MVNQASRRHFLRSAPLAAAALPFSATLLRAEQTPQQPIMAVASVPFHLFPAAELAEDMKQLHAKPGNNNLFDASTLPFTVVMTVEDKHAAKEFEWHEGRDHVVQILEGSTVYEVGGRPQGGHNPKPGEWLAPASDGATTYTLSKGDMLVIPRGTPHKRTTADSVTFYLISSTGK